MSPEKDTRLRNLKAVLKQRGVPERARMAHLAERVGSSKSYWSGMLAGDRPFGERIARRIEVSLGLRSGCLDEPSEGSPPLSPDAHALGEAFDALPTKTEDDLKRRQWIYWTVLRLLEDEQRGADPNTPGSPPDGQPNGAPRPLT